MTSMTVNVTTPVTVTAVGAQVPLSAMTVSPMPIVTHEDTVSALKIGQGWAVYNITASVTVSVLPVSDLLKMTVLDVMACSTLKTGV